ncbi:MAG: GTP pyrophosphokinase family protein [Defluviitaleaceae bacterium]|nr:GTP pyrophosphokinase family protein [Defluviitaleaceae bacterium]MCL2239519.1 GTP pyrophosphokinase family protein [Defluviitaleaceae bacterium]
MAILFTPPEFMKMKETLVLYRCALRNMEMRMDILLEDFENIQKHNPIEHVKLRVKSYESIAQKLHRQDHPITAESARQNLTDIAGLRCICAYTRDIFTIANVFKNQPDIKLIKERNYIDKPKPSGYRSHHLVFEVPVYLSGEILRLPVEVQIRTQAMDFWASLEHKIRYKYKSGIPIHLAEGLKECAAKISDLDERMYKIQELIDIAY